MRSGRLARVLIIEERDPASSSPRQSSTGARLGAWQQFARVRGFIRPISGKEMRAAEQAQGAIDTEIEIRYIAGVKGAGVMRARWQGEPAVAYSIHAAIDPEKRQKKLLLQCSSGVSNA